MRPLTYLLASLLACSFASYGHDIPADVTVQAYVRPSGQRLQFVVRVPLKVLRDIDFPQTRWGYLDIEELAPKLPAAVTLWISNFVSIYEGETRLPRPTVVDTQISLPSDKSFTTFEEALRRVTGPKLLSSARVSWDQVLLDVLFEYPIRSDRSDFSIRPGLEHLAAQVVTVVRFVPPNGPERAYEFRGDPGIVPLDPRWHQAARRFVELGFFHILDGIDHLLFLLCLVIPLRQFRSLVVVVTSFTVAHSITLIASAAGFAPDALWFPPLIETLIAASIVYMAIENIIGTSNLHRRWMIAFGFGLVHGFGFSFALRESLQLAGSHLLSSLVAFNIGVELGQILVLLLLIPILDGLFRYVVDERMGTIILSAFVAHTGWHWMIERWEHLRQFPFALPHIRAAVWVTVLRLLTLVLITWGLARVAMPWFRRTQRER